MQSLEAAESINPASASTAVKHGRFMIAFVQKTLLNCTSKDFDRKTLFVY